MDYKIMTSATECKEYQMPFGAPQRETKYSIFNIGFGDNELEDCNNILEDEFYISEYDDCFESLTKQTYDSDGEEYNFFKYKYMIEAALCPDDEHVYCNIFMVPLPEYLSEKKQQDIRESYGFDDDFELTCEHVYRYCGGVVMAHCVVESNEITKDIVDQITSVIMPIDCMRGFYLDASKNMLGINGWGFLDEILKDIDPVKELLKKYEESCTQSK